MWNMTSSCWQQDPTRRTTAEEVVGLLRGWSVLLLSVEPTSLHGACRHRLRLMDPSSSPLRCQPVKNIGGTTNNASAIPAPTNGGPISPGTTRDSRQSDFHTKRISVEPSPVLDSPHGLSPDEPIFDSGNTHGDHPLPIAHNMRSPCQYPPYRPNAECPSRKVGPRSG